MWDLQNKETYVPLISRFDAQEISGTRESDGTVETVHADVSVEHIREQMC